MPYWIVTRDSKGRTGILKHSFNSQEMAGSKAEELELQGSEACTAKAVYSESYDYNTFRQELKYKDVKEYGIDESHRNIKRLSEVDV